ncbi:MAG: bifunctional 2-polyprenyl-6-hydroxyphenol methylase/3-demethylubiquinol 3-O-methyltransferase UbiG [Hyphomicrobiaceae bacterium]
MTLQANDLEIYDAHADCWWDGSIRWLRTLHNLVPARLSYFDQFVESWAGKRVIDVGCGGGFMAESLAECSAEVVGIDQSRRAIEVARAHAISRNLSIDYHTGRAECLDFPDESFDVVVCVDVLEHLDERALAIAEMSRVLKTGGHFVFDTINRNWLAKFSVVTAAERIVGLLPRGAHDPDLFIGPKDLRMALARENLHVVDAAGLGPVGIYRNFDIQFGRLPLTLVQYMGAAVKVPPASLY